MFIPCDARAVKRLQGVDVARGLAVLLMIQTHAFDGWASAEAKRTFAYRITRELGAIPAPLFLLLAGVGLALGADAMIRRGSSIADARRKLARRGLEVVLWGYLVSLAYAAIDWSWALPQLLRADILHAIGLSMALLAFVLVGRSTRVVVVLVILLCGLGLALAPLMGDVELPQGQLHTPVAAVVGLFVDVPGYTRFPVFPLIGFVAIGFLVGRTFGEGADASSALGLAMGLIVVAAVATWLTRVWVAIEGGTLSRAHPAVVANFVDGAARAGAVLALGLALTPLARRLGAVLRLGRFSLTAYALHIPFCYGRLARPVAHRLDMLEGAVGVAALTILTYAGVWTRERMAAKKRRAMETTSPATSLTTTPRRDQVSLVREATDAEREALMVSGKAPAFEDLVGWEFAGLNCGAITDLLRIRKFKKGFYEGAPRVPAEAGPSPFIHGYNVDVFQDGVGKPHRAYPSEDAPKRHGYYRVHRVVAGARDAKYPNALLLDYGLGKNGLQPSGLLRDYLVQPYPDDRDLLLGKAYLALFGLRIPAGFFVLQRQNRHEHAG